MADKQLLHMQYLRSPACGPVVICSHCAEGVWAGCARILTAKELAIRMDGVGTHHPSRLTPRWGCSTAAKQTIVLTLSKGIYE
jgi:hypothetical protein